MEEEEETAVFTFYKRFMDQDGVYYGEVPEGEENFDEEERTEEINGQFSSSHFMLCLKLILS